MGMFEELIQQAQGLDLDEIGAKVGLTPDQVATAARSLLPQIADPAVDNGEAAEAVASGTGIPRPSLEALVPVLLQQAQNAGASGGAFESILTGLRGGGQQGGEQQGGVLGSIAGALDRDGDGNPLDDVLGMFGGGGPRPT